MRPQLVVPGGAVPRDGQLGEPRLGIAERLPRQDRHHVVLEQEDGERGGQRHVQRHLCDVPQDSPAPSAATANESRPDRCARHRRGPPLLPRSSVDAVQLALERPKLVAADAADKHTRTTSGVMWPFAGRSVSRRTLAIRPTSNPNRHPPTALVHRLRRPPSPQSKR